MSDVSDRSSRAALEADGADLVVSVDAAPEPVDPAGLVADGFRDGVVVDLEGAEVAASVLAALLLDPPSPAAGRVPALRLQRARISGVLDLECAQIGVAVSLERCRFDAAPQLAGAETRSVHLDRCRMPGLSARLAVVRGDLRILGCTLNGTLSLENADVSGTVVLSGSRLMRPGGRALSAGGLRVGGGVVGRGRLVVEGEARLVGAQVSGGVLLQGARFGNRGGVALCLDELVTNRLELSDGFTATGQVLMRNAQVSGRFSLYGARLDGATGTSGPGAARALRARGMSAGELELRPASVEGLVDLSQARVGALRDSEDTWPAHLRLDGFTYEHLLGTPAPSAAARCRWLAREQEDYRPQPYEQLAEYYRRLGHDADARRVLLAKERRRRRTRPVLARAGGYLLDGIVGYGYRSELAAAWLALLVVVGTVVFSGHPPRALDPEHQPHFTALVYTVDLLIPIGAFGLRNAYDPVGWTVWVADALIASGWILATALIAGVSRRVGRD